MQRYDPPLPTEPLAVKEGRGKKLWILRVEEPTPPPSSGSQTQILDSSLLLPCPYFSGRSQQATPTFFPLLQKVTRPSCLGLSEVLLFRATIKFYLLKHDGLEGGEPTRNLKNQRSSPWPRLELFFQLNDNRFCLRNCYVIWCMGVIWLRTRDGSTSHKILPEFPDLCVLCCFYLLLGLFTCFRNIKKRTSLEIQKATENLLNSFI